MEILLVEDESRVRKFLEDALRAEGHNLHSCESIEEVEAWLAVDRESPDVAILDRMVHGGDAAHLIQPLKTRFPSIKIIILSAIGIADEKAQILDSGADDYISKPFSFAELTARIRALARRSTSSTPSATLLRTGNLQIELKTQLVRTEKSKLDLSKKEFQVLCALASHPGRVFTKYQLLDRVWDQQVDIESNIVEVTIKNLRRKLESAKSTAQILSKRNVGYWIEA